MEVEKQCIPILIDATPEGKKELIGFQTGFRESAQSQAELLTDLKSRGCRLRLSWRSATALSAFENRWNSNLAPPDTRGAGCIK